MPFQMLSFLFHSLLHNPLLPSNTLSVCFETSIPVGEELLGRIVNPLGQPLDGKGPIKAQHYDVIEK